jgi:hypothetical protein
MGATLSRKRNNIGLGWYISRPAEWQKWLKRNYKARECKLNSTV